MARMLVVAVTNQTSPYQVEFMDAIAREGAVALRVVYLHSQRPGRQWRQPDVRHEHVVLDEDRARFQTAQQWVKSAGLVVFGYYRAPFAAELIQMRSLLHQPWCFWGERMGVTRGAWAGAFYRRWKLRALHRDPAAIWGIGEFALENYRREFGSNRVYCNVPYFSNLDRFSVSRNERRSDDRKVLFSGTFSPRKGVDVLASAFREVGREFPNLRLTFVGDGEQRMAIVSELSECGDRVTYAGFQDWADLPRFYRDADVLCAPSRHDGWGLVVPEGLAAGLPVIGTRKTGAARELIRDGENGWLIDAGDRQQLAEALRKVARLTDHELATMSRAALQSVAGHQLSDGVRRFHQAVAATLEGWRVIG